jgi:hypothetical protein
LGFPAPQLAAIVRRMSDDIDIFKRTMRAVVRAIAEEAKGLNLSEATLADLQSAAPGEIDTDEVTRRIYQRLGTQPPANVP